MFGQPSAANTSGTSFFGQQQQQQAQANQSTSLFGAPAATSAFGAAVNPMGGGNNGTAIAKYQPLIGQDTLMKNNQTQSVTTNQHCITAMAEYENSSLEELRHEDYAANRKGPQSGVAPGAVGGLFGAAGPSTSGIFGAPATQQTTAFGQPQDNKGLFGQQQSTLGGFGQTTNAFGANTSQNNMFKGFNTPATSAPAFGFNNTTATNTAQNNSMFKGFGAPATGATGGGLFGAAQPTTSTSVFGQPAQQQQQPAFGSTFGQQGTAAAPSLFGQAQDNKPAFGQPATSTGFNFGANTGGMASGGLFGQAKPPENAFGGGAFGASTSAAPAPAFGAAQPTQSLFGNTFGAKPATAPFQGFGTQANVAPLGQAGGGLFGNAAQKPGGLFGSTAPSTLGQPGSLFSGFGATTGMGTSTLGGGGGMGAFGAQPQQQQATVPIHQQILDMTSNPYGDNPIFKDLKPVPSEDALRPTNPNAQKAVLEANATQFKVSSKVGSGVKVKPIGGAGSKKSLFDGLEEYDSSVDLFSMKPSAKRLNIRAKGSAANESAGALNSSRTFLLNQSDTVDTPRRATTSATSANKENRSDSFQSRLQRQQQQQQQSPWESAAETSGVSGRDSWIQSNALEKARMATTAHRNAEPALSSTIHELIPDRRQSGSQETSPRPGDLSQRSAATCVSQTSSLDSLASRTFNPDETNAELIDPCSSHPTGIVLKRVGYYTIPSLDELCSYLSEDGSCWVDNFTIGREGYGNVYFSERMDVANLQLDEVVFFRNKEVIIYPMDDQKPPVGEGLNRKAQITLDQVWPTDKTSHEAIKDPERLQAMDYEGKLRRACYKHETRFIDYRPETGSWVFRVDHFSKYGLSDSDDEEEGESAEGVQGPKKPKMAQPIEGARKNSDGEVKMNSGGVRPKQQQGRAHKSVATAVTRPLDDLDMEEDQYDGTYANYRNTRTVDVTSPSSAVASGYGVDAHKLQLMKASFFIDEANDNDEEEESEGAREAEESERRDQVFMSRFNMGRDSPDQTVPNRQFSQYSSMQSLFRDSSVNSMKTMMSENTNKTSTTLREATIVEGESLLLGKATTLPVISQPAVKVIAQPPLIIRPKIHEVRASVVVLPDAMSVMTMKTANENCFLDLSLLFGRKFKIGFGGQNKMTFVTNVRDSEMLQGSKLDLPHVARLFQGRSVNNLTWPVVASLKINSRQEIKDFSRSVEDHLKIQLNFSAAKQPAEEEQANRCPQMTVTGGTSLLLSHFEQACAYTNSGGEYQKYAKSVWALCMALWGEDDCLEGQEASGHLAMMRRRELVSAWLEEVVAERGRNATSGGSTLGKAKEDYLEHLLELLFAHKVVEACELAFANDDVNLALLLAQISGGPVVRQLIQHQLSCWQEVEADTYIEPNRLKAYMLVAGTPLLSSTHGIINVFNDADWITGLAIHLWYLCSPTLSVTDALLNYEKDFMHVDEIVAAPSPPYATEFQVQSDQPIQDIRFHLLKLYSKRSHRLEALLNPATHTTDPMDFRLSWFLMQTLKTLGYRHCSPLAEAQLTTSFAGQLELQGMWQWTVFVLMHLEGAGRREATIKEVLNRFIRLNGEKECSKAYQEKEAFVIHELKVPSEWVYAAKAMRAGVFDRHHDQVKFYLKAKEWSQAHEVLMERIAPDCIINGEWVEDGN